MKLFKYSLIFSISNTALLLIVNYPKGNHMFLKLFLTIWIIVTTLSVFVLSTALKNLLDGIKAYYTLLIICLVTFLVLNFMVATMDPNNLGMIGNLIYQYQDVRMFYNMVLPYLASMLITVLICVFVERNKDATVE